MDAKPPRQDQPSFQDGMDGNPTSTTSTGTGQSEEGTEWLPFNWLAAEEVSTSVSPTPYPISVESAAPELAQSNDPLIKTVGVECGIEPDGSFYAVVSGVMYKDPNLLPYTLSRKMIRLFSDKFAEAMSLGTISIKITFQISEAALETPLPPENLKPIEYSMGNALGGALSGIIRRKPSSTNSSGPVTASIGNMINRIIERRLANGMVTLDYPIKVIDTPDGSININYGTEVYNGISDMPEGPARTLVQSAVEEWNGL